jgi:hypothetical protein
MLDNFETETTSFVLLVVLETFGAWPTIRIEVTMKTLSSPLILEAIIEEPLSSYYQLHFSSITNLFQEIKADHNALTLSEEGILTIYIDPERTSSLRQLIREQ